MIVDLQGPGAISVAPLKVYIESTGVSDCATLIDGYEGQLLHIYNIADRDSRTYYIILPASLRGGIMIELEAQGIVGLKFIGEKWEVLFIEKGIVVS